MLLTAAALTGNSQKRRERRKKRAKHGEGYGTLTWPFSFHSPTKLRYMLLLNSLLDFAYNNAINSD